MNKSTSSSSSGEGLGLGNVTSVGGGQGIGGIEPRTTPINGDVNTFDTGSNSGENSGADTGSQPDVGITPVAP